MGFLWDFYGISVGIWLPSGYVKQFAIEHGHLILVNFPIENGDMVIFHSYQLIIDSWNGFQKIATLASSSHMSFLHTYADQSYIAPKLRTVARQKHRVSFIHLA